MENKETILKLYDFFMDTIYQEVPRNEEELLHIIENEDKLNNSLTKEQKKLLEEIREQDIKKEEEINKHIFVSAFSLAVKLFAEGLQKNN